MPVLIAVARLIARVFYRLTITGGRVPRAGPALLVANHTNALLDPALVLAAARRSVRLLAKSTLFQVPLAGPLLRWAGAVPVYRRKDDPLQTGKNVEMFAAVEDVLVAGGAIGIFPEGISHDATSLAPLRTGAARIALASAARLGHACPIVPIGLVFAGKATFRSEAAALVGDAVAWDDLALRGADDAEAVRELTSRIDAALRQVSLNVASRADLPLLECAADVYAAEVGGDPGWAHRVTRVNVAAQLLDELRASEGDSPEWMALLSDLRRHARRLRLTGLTPGDVASDPGAGAVMRWTVRTLPFVAFTSVLIAAVGGACYYLPYGLTRLVAARLARRLDPDTHGTVKALAGIVIHTAWTVALAAAAGTFLGWWIGVAAVVALPALGFTALIVAERWRASRDDARRFLLLRRKRAIVDGLRADQCGIAERIGAIVAADAAAGRG